MLKHDPQLRLARQLAMTPQMQQATRLLLLPTVELQAQVQQALEENPLLETNEEFEATWAIDSMAGQVFGDESSVEGERSTERIVDGHTLQDHLAWQLEVARLPAGPMVIGCALIDAIGEDGLLTRTTESIAEAIAGKVRADSGVMEWVLATIQGFDPPGVGARSESECIGLQLAQLDPATPGLETARTLAHRHLKRIAEKQFTALQGELPCGAEELDAAIALVRSCQVRPGAAFRALRTEYAVPDAFARRTPEGWNVELNPSALPFVRLNEASLGMITRAPEYALQRVQLHEARWLMGSLKLRNDMMLRVARTIVERQQAFLDRSEESMQPMILRDVADAVQMHESTVSRVTTGKYLQTPRGVFEFRAFFSSHVPGEFRAGASSVRSAPGLAG